MTYLSVRDPPSFKISTYFLILCWLHRPQVLAKGPFTDELCIGISHLRAFSSSQTLGSDDSHHLFLGLVSTFFWTHFTTQRLLLLPVIVIKLFSYFVEGTRKLHSAVL